MRKIFELEHISWKDGNLVLLDQRQLPHNVAYIECSTFMEVVKAIKTLAVRGAPAIGISAAYALALAAKEANSKCLDRDSGFDFIMKASESLLMSRPTAVNLRWSIEKGLDWLNRNREIEPEQVIAGLLDLAREIHREDLDNNLRMGAFGAELIPEEAHILTHCNAGALATGGYGTALGVIRSAFEAGKKIRVYVDETRPLLQGARITTFEMEAAGIPYYLITDNCAGHIISRGEIDLILVGADRIAANGDTANKIGTYTLAVLAKHHRIPFYIAAPTSTIDPAAGSGTDIVVEERDGKEVTHFSSISVAPAGTSALNYAFDVTPANLITAIITEKGVARQPFENTLPPLLASDKI